VPGTIAATWQQAGRAGRGGKPSLAVLVASPNPLDQYLAKHPDYFFSRSPEFGMINPDNFDDWLVASVQQENETQYFSDFNHGIIQRIPLNSSKQLKALKVRAVANEVIVGILGISVQK
jgi:hypothetical protein